MGCLHQVYTIQQTSSKCIQNTCAVAGRLLDRVNTLLVSRKNLRTNERKNFQEIPEQLNLLRLVWFYNSRRDIHALFKTLLVLTFRLT